MGTGRRHVLSVRVEDISYRFVILGNVVLSRKSQMNRETLAT